MFAVKNNSTFVLSLPHIHDILPIFLPVLFVCFLATTINILTIIVILRSKTLSRPGNYPIISILLGSAIQASLTVPAYTLKRLYHGDHHHIIQLRWICDLYRFSYFICGHQLKVSLFLVSCDRLVAIQFPYRYKEIVTKTVSLIVLSVSWLLVVIIDIIPFSPFGKERDAEGCTFIPQHSWSIFVILVFNVLVFCCTFINYAFVWRVTALMTLKDYSERQTAIRLRSIPKVALTMAPSETHQSATTLNSSTQVSMQRPSSQTIHSNQKTSVVEGGFINESLFSKSAHQNNPTTTKRGFSLSLLTGDHTKLRRITVTECSLSSCPKFAKEEKINERKPSVVQFKSPCKDPSEGKTDANQRRFSCPVNRYCPDYRYSGTKTKSITEEACSLVVSLTSLGANRTARPLNNSIDGDNSQLQLSLPASSWTLSSRKKTRKASSRASSMSTNSLSLRLALEMKSTKTALMLCGVYLLCWGSLGMFYLTDNLCNKCISKDNNLAVERLLVKVISFTSSLFLPLVYCWRTDAFWEEIKDFTCMKVCSDTICS